MNELDEQLMKEMMLASRFIMRPHGRPMVQEDIIRKLKDGPVSQKELQEEMHVRPGSISEVISKLEDKGLLTRMRSNEDARAVEICLTEEGEKKSKTLKEKENLFSSLTDEEKIQLKDILMKLNNDWIRRDPIPPMDERPPFPPFGHGPHGHFPPPHEMREDGSFMEKPPFPDHHSKGI